MALLCVRSLSLAQVPITIRVMDSSNDKMLEGAVIRMNGYARGATEPNGTFTLPMSDTLLSIEISLVGFEKVLFSRPFEKILTAKLLVKAKELDEVTISTGYQHIPKERATGSFTLIGQDVLERKFNPDLLASLEGVAGSLAFDRRSMTDNDGTPAIRIRGVSTMYANTQPLIVLDNFPFEGDIQAINPSDIASVTILKDAAAASIWGVRAANGVIVITTKQGKLSEKATLGFSHHTALQQRPDLFYSPAFLGSQSFMEMEEILFDAGLYDSRINSANKQPISPFVQVLQDHKQGKYTDEEVAALKSKWGEVDIRRDAGRYLYQKAVDRQYDLNMEGGGQKHTYYLSLGYLGQQKQAIRSRNQRITLGFNNSLQLLDRLTVQSRLLISLGKRHDNGVDFLSLSDRLYPYARLKELDGTNGSIVRDYSDRYKSEQEALGLLDWSYRPLDELANNHRIDNTLNLNWQMSLGYQIMKGLSLDLNYQYGQLYADQESIDSKESYYVRHTVNRYTQLDLARAFPEGDILNVSTAKSETHSLRPMLKLDRSIGEIAINGIAGAEVKQFKALRHSLLRYGYDRETLTSTANLNYNVRYNLRPSGTSFLPSNAGSDTQMLDRYVSYFSNLAVTFKDRYIWSGSARWDASNLFGVNTNQRGVPLWSIGGAWIMDKEDFYQWAAIPKLKVRATYGYNGNLDKSVSAFPTARYSMDSQSGLLSAQITNPGNPALRWEKVAVLNLAIDFSSKDRRVEGTLDFYKKRSTDLFGFSFIDPTAFYSGSAGASFKQNYANMDATGVDMELKVKKMTRPNLSWQGTYLLSMVKNSVTAYFDDGRGNLDGYFLGRFTKPLIGYPLDVLFSYPWHGLDGKGNPIVYLDGEPSLNYSKFRQEAKLDDLIYHGSSIPTLFGSIRQDVAYKGIRLGFNLVYKFKYFYRRQSIDYYNFHYMNKGHTDYDKRWKQPGDEQWTDVPSLVTPIDFNRDLVYGYADVLVEPGDHVRLQDVVVGYDLRLRSKTIKSLRINGSVSNVGILWRKSRSGVDPDYPMSFLAPNRIYSIGLNMGLQ